MPLRTSVLDRIILETLKDVHNRGADLYNAGDSAGAFRVYQGALLVVHGFLMHRPAIRQNLLEGLTEVREAAGNWHLLAYRLHEVIDQIRADLKAEFLKRDVVKPGSDSELVPVTLEGVVQLGGVAIAGAVIMLTAPSDGIVAAAVTDLDGVFVVTVRPGEYGVTLVGPGVPAQFQTLESSPLRVKLVGERQETVIELGL